MDRDERLICPAQALVEGGSGVRFRVNRLGAAERGFVVRYDGEARAFVNECPHAFTELDWNPGEFFDEAGLYLVCATHGAHFEPHTGLCVAGPCRGARLARLPVRERDGAIYLLDDPPKDGKVTDAP
jgi:nitrite reductase/ring-hydroxylating ferredoxin subunit